MHTRNERYTRAADGQRLAYHVIPGEGPTMIFANGFATTHNYWRHILASYHGRARLITWDYPGHGQSDPVRGPMSVARLADDMARVLDAADAPDAIWMGFSFGCQVVLEAARAHSARQRALVLALGTFERPFDSLFHPRVGGALFQLFRALAPRVGPGLRLTGSPRLGPLLHRAGQLGGHIERNIPLDEMRPFFEGLAGLDPASWAAIGAAAQSHSARALLPHIDAPALIIAGGRDAWTPSLKSRELDALLPHSELVFFPQATHTGLLGHAAPILDALERFFLAHDLVR